MTEQKPGIRLGAVRLGDAAEKALSLVGITSERVERWLGRPCRCKERRDRLNAFGAWVQRILSGKTENASQHLDDITGDKETKS
jgi:hypothetical protein